MDVETINLVGWDFWIVNGVESESEGKDDDDEEEETAITATYAPQPVS